MNTKLTYALAKNKYHESISNLHEERRKILREVNIECLFKRSESRKFKEWASTSPQAHIAESYFVFVTQTRQKLIDDGVFESLNESWGHRKFYALNRWGDGVIMSRRKGKKYHVDMNPKQDIRRRSGHGSDGWGGANVVGEIVEGVFDIFT